MPFQKHNIEAKSVIPLMSFKSSQTNYDRKMNRGIKQAELLIKVVLEDGCIHVFHFNVAM